MTPGAATTSAPQQQRPPIAPVALNFSEYAGKYWSDELAVEYNITAKSDGLRIEFGDQVQNAVAVAADRFRVGSLEYQFTRDGSKVDGFVVNAGRVTGIRFRRR
jgi:hypothetical protein